MARTDANLKIGADTRQASAAIKKLNRDLAGVKLDSLINLGGRAKDASDSVAHLVGSFQEAKIVLNKLTGGDGFAKFSEISDIAGKTQFDVRALTNEFVKLQGAGVEGATEKLTTFADVAAGTSDQLGTMTAMSDLFARTISGGLNLVDLIRLFDKGLPVFAILKDEMGLAKDEITKFGKSAEGAKKITDTLFNALGKKYGGLAAESAKTLGKAYDNAGMKMDELTVKLYDKMGITGGLTSLMFFIDATATLMTRLLEATDNLSERMGRLSGTKKLTALAGEIIDIETALGKAYVSRSNTGGRAKAAAQTRIDILTKELNFAKELKRNALIKEAQIAIDIEATNARKRKNALAGAISAGLGGFESPKLAMQKADDDFKRLKDAEVAMTKISEADKMRINEAYAQIQLRLVKANADAELKVETDVIRWKHDKQLAELGLFQTNQLRKFEFRKKLEESKNELLDRLDEARLEGSLFYLDQETQALIRKHDFEIKLEERLSQRKQKLREVEFRNKGFGTEASKKMAVDEADFNNKTKTEQAQWAIQQGATALDALGQHSRKAFELAKAFNIANAIMNTMTGVTKALAQGGIFGLITGAVVLASGLANVATIRSQQYQGRQFGGTVTGNKPYMVGEKGPELFVPGKTGSVVNNGELQNGSTTNITFEINAVDASGVDELIAERQDMIVGMIRNAHEDAGYDARL